MDSPHLSSFEDEKKTAEAEVDLEVLDTSDVDEAALLRKVDWHILPLICVLYFVTFLDRYVCRACPTHQRTFAQHVPESTYRMQLSLDSRAT
jgi:hypothetical protein